MTGTLIKKIDPYQKCPSKTPLATGPKAPAAPVTLAQIAIAFGRSWAGKTLMMIESVDGMISAPATPMIARQAMSWPMPLACEASVAPTRNRPRPSCRAPLRPNLSPSAPVENRSPAKTSE